METNLWVSCKLLLVLTGDLQNETVIFCFAFALLNFQSFNAPVRFRPRSALERGCTRSRPATGNVEAIEETDENAPETEAVKVEPPTPPSQPDVLTLDEAAKEVSIFDKHKFAAWQLCAFTWSSCHRLFYLVPLGVIGKKSWCRSSQGSLSLFWCRYPDHDGLAPQWDK